MLTRVQTLDSSILAEQGGMEGKERTDLLSKLQFGKDENGKRLSPEEVTAEALSKPNYVFSASLPSAESK